MQYCRSFGVKHWFGVVLGLTTLLLLSSSEQAFADLPGIMIIDIHDGEPWAANWDTGPTYMSGNFMTGIDTWGTGFWVERIWFYHGGDYPDSGAHYQIHFVWRFRYGDDEEFYCGTYLDRYTTCNYCWEELEIDYPIWDAGSDEDTTFGVFIRPFDGTGGSGFHPRLWRDRYADHYHLAALLDVSWPPPPEPGSNVGNRDPYHVQYYNSDSGLGEVLLGMEVSSDVITSTQEMNFSTIKSLY
jgi:hypothetical protein